MAHRIAERVADRIVAGQAVAMEDRMSYVQANDIGAGNPLKCCAIGMLYVGTFLTRRGHIANVVKSWEQRRDARMYTHTVLIAQYARIPWSLTVAIEQLHLHGRRSKTCDEIVMMLRSGELDQYCE